MNTFGNIYRLTSFGESHGAAMGGVIDGMIPGVTVDMNALQRYVARRRPGQSSLTTSRCETDEVEILSGIYNGSTTGTPIGFIIRNADMRPSDYDENARLLRPSHADYTYELKYGLRDPRGGGRSSARETVSRMVAGALASQVLSSLGVDIVAFTSQIGDVRLPGRYTDYDLSGIDSNPVRCPDEATARKMIELIERVKSEGDTTGGVVTCVVRNCPAGLGEPVFGKLNARLASAMMSINAAKGFDIGMGFNGVGRRGSEVADIFAEGDGAPVITANNSGGVQGGISNGRDIYMRVAFKPVATMMCPMPTTDIQGRPAVLHGRGRHDACVVPRAVPIVEAMAAMTIFDAYLENKRLL